MPSPLRASFAASHPGFPLLAEDRPDLVESLLRLIHDENLRRKMGGIGRDRATSCFGRAQLPERLEDLYRWAQSD